MTWIRNSGGHAIPRASPSFFTDFTTDENPLSEAGVWNAKPVPTVWTNAVKKLGGVAIDAGAATSFNDAVAVLVGSWNAHQRVTCTISVAGAFATSEVEIHLRFSFNSTQIFAYEVDCVPSGVAIEKWTGTQGSVFNLPLTNGTTGSYVGSVQPSSGDQFQAEITDSGGVATIKVWQIVSGASTLIAQADDSLAISGTAIHTTGNPGIGFDNGNGNVGWTDFLSERLT